MISRCAITLTMEYDFIIEGGHDEAAVKETLKEVTTNLELHSMHRILNTYGELLNVCAIPIKAIVTPLVEREAFNIDLKEGEALEK